MCSLSEVVVLDTKEKIIEIFGKPRELNLEYDEFIAQKRLELFNNNPVILGVVPVISEEGK